MNYLKHQPKNRLQKFFNNWNEHLTVPAIIALALLVIVVSLLASCQKESSFTRGEPTIESDKHLVPPGGYNTKVRDERPELWEAARKGGNGKGKGKPYQPPTDTTGGGGDTTYNPPPTGQGVILLDFDGQTVEGTYWNVNGPIYARYSGMNETEIQTTVDSIQADYSEFGVVVTTDESVYYAAPVNKRVRVIITESWEWYGQAGGVAYLGSFTWGNETPAWVFSSLLGYNPKNVWEAASHEAGHTLGLRHQAKWLDATGAVCNSAAQTPVTKVSDYHDGEGLLYAPIPGVGYYKWATWHVGWNSYGNLQDDRAIIRATLNQ